MVTAAETIKALVAELGIAPEGVAVEVNLAIVSKRDYGTFRLSEGDAVEVVRLVGGGRG